MAGNWVKPKTYNRHFAINIGTSDDPVWAEFCKGVSSRGNSINEETEEYYDMCGRGVADTEVVGQQISRTFSGFRVFGDRAQDFIYFDRLYDFNSREVEYLDWYDNMPADIVTARGNGCKGTGTLTIADDGSGDANARENVEWGLTNNGIPTSGNVKKNEPTAGATFPTYEFTELTTP